MHLEQLYLVEVSPSVISAVTAEVMGEVITWKQRPQARVDGLLGSPEAITTAFSQAQVHHCVVRLVRQSLAFVNWKERK